MEKESVLVGRALGGDADAFGEIIDCYTDPLYAMAYGYVGNQADAKDLVQEIFILVYSALKDLKDPLLFQHWLFRIAKNKALDWIAQKKRPSTTDPALIDQIVADGEEGGELQAKQAADKSQRVAAILSALPEEHRVVLSLRYMQQCKYEQIAEILELDVTTVRNRLIRAKRYVKKHLNHLSTN